MKDKPKKIMGIKGLSEYLDISHSTAYKLAQEGKVPGQKVGKHWRFREETINKWLDGTEKSEVRDNDKITLSDVLPEDKCDELKNYWIETPEQFITMTVTQDQKDRMAKLLDISLDKLQKINDGFLSQMSQETVDALLTLKRGGELGYLYNTDKGNDDDNDRSDPSI